MMSETHEDVRYIGDYDGYRHSLRDAPVDLADESYKVRTLVVYLCVQLNVVADNGGD